MFDDPKWHIPTYAECVEYFVRNGDTEQAGADFWRRCYASSWKTATGKWIPYIVRANEVIEAHRTAYATQQAVNAQQSQRLTSPIDNPVVQDIYPQKARPAWIPPDTRNIIAEIIEHPSSYSFKARVKAVLSIERFPVFFPLELQAQAVNLRFTLKENMVQYEKFEKYYTPILREQFGGG